VITFPGGVEEPIAAAHHDKGQGTVDKNNLGCFPNPNAGGKPKYLEQKEGGGRCVGGVWVSGFDDRFQLSRFGETLRFSTSYKKSLRNHMPIDIFPIPVFFIDCFDHGVGGIF